MSHAILGKTFDIHGGGLDLMFPHHENERAQSGCCHDAPMVKYWMHNGLMRAGEKGKVGGKSDRESSPDDAAGKISRSKGAGGLADLIRRHTGERIRFFLLRTHYRSTILYGEDGLEESGASLEGFYRFFDRYQSITGQPFYELPALDRRTEFQAPDTKDATVQEVVALRDKYLAAMDDDFNTGLATSVLFDLLRTANRHIDQHKLTSAADANSPAVASLKVVASVLRELTAVLGLFRKPVSGAAGGEETQKVLDDVMSLVIDLRKDARARKDFRYRRSDS